MHGWWIRSEQFCESHWRITTWAQPTRSNALAPDVTVRTALVSEEPFSTVPTFVNDVCFGHMSGRHRSRLALTPRLQPMLWGTVPFARAPCEWRCAVLTGKRFISVSYGVRAPGLPVGGMIRWSGRCACP